MGEDDGIEVAAGDAAEPGVDVAAQPADVQAQTERLELGTATRGPGADSCSRGQLTEGESVACHERIAGVLTHGDGGDDVVRPRASWGGP